MQKKIKVKVSCKASNSSPCSVVISTYPYNSMMAYLNYAACHLRTVPELSTFILDANAKLKPEKNIDALKDPIDLVKIERINLHANHLEQFVWSEETADKAEFEKNTQVAGKEDKRIGAAPLRVLSTQISNSLLHLAIGFNNLQKLTLPTLPHLQTLEIQYNSLCDLHMLLDTVRQQPQLRELWAAGNPLALKRGYRAIAKQCQTLCSLDGVANDDAAVRLPGAPNSVAGADVLDIKQSMSKKPAAIATLNGSIASGANASTAKRRVTSNFTADTHSETRITAYKQMLDGWLMTEEPLNENVTLQVTLSHLVRLPNIVNQLLETDKRRGASQAGSKDMTSTAKKLISARKETPLEPILDVEDCVSFHIELNLPQSVSSNPVRNSSEAAALLSKNVLTFQPSVAWRDSLHNGIDACLYEVHDIKTTIQTPQMPLTNNGAENTQLRRSPRSISPRVEHVASPFTRKRELKSSNIDITYVSTVEKRVESKLVGIAHMPLPSLLEQCSRNAINVQSFEYDLVFIPVPDDVYSSMRAKQRYLTSSQVEFLQRVSNTESIAQAKARKLLDGGIADFVLENTRAQQDTSLLPSCHIVVELNSSIQEMPLSPRFAARKSPSGKTTRRTTDEIAASKTADNRIMKAASASRTPASNSIA